MNYIFSLNKLFKTKLVMNKIFIVKLMKKPK